MRTANVIYLESSNTVISRTPYAGRAIIFNRLIVGNEESLYYKKDIVVPKTFVRSPDHNNAISSPYIYGYIKKCVHLSAKTLMSLFLRRK